MDVEHLVLDAENPGALGDLRFAAARQRPASLAEVPDVAVRHRHELDLVSLRRPECRDAARLQLGVIGMCPEGNDPKGRRLCLLGTSGSARHHGDTGRQEQHRAEQSFHMCSLAGNVGKQCDGWRSFIRKSPRNTGGGL